MQMKTLDLFIWFYGKLLYLWKLVSYCSVWLFGIFENFWRRFELNWSLFAKNTKELEIRKGKEKRKIKIKLDPRGNDLAQPEFQPAAHLAKSRTGTPPPSLSLAARWTPPVISHLPLIPLPLPLLETAGVYSLFNSLKPLPVSISLRTYKKAALPSHLSLFPSPDSAARQWKLHVGAPHACGHFRSIPTTTVNRDPPLLAYSLPLAPVPPLTSFVWFISQ
jgi:hypothetical protein